MVANGPPLIIKFSSFYYKIFLRVFSSENPCKIRISIFINFVKIIIKFMFMLHKF